MIFLFQNHVHSQNIFFLFLFPSLFSVHTSTLLLQPIMLQLVVSIITLCTHLEMFYATLSKFEEEFTSSTQLIQFPCCFDSWNIQYSSGMPWHTLLNADWPHYFSKFSLTHFPTMTLVSTLHGYLYLLDSWFSIQETSNLTSLCYVKTTRINACF